MEGIDFTPQDLIDGIMQLTDDLSEKNERLALVLVDRICAQSTYDNALQTAISSLRESKYPQSLMLAKAKTMVTSEREPLEIARVNIECLRNDIALIKTTIDCYRSLLSWWKAELLNS
jgi:hypothetical protein